MKYMSLDDICEMVTDGTHASFKDSGKGFPFLTVKDMTENGLDFSGCIHISQEEYDRADAGNSAPKLGDVLFSKDGTVGKVCVVREKREFAVLSSIAILRPKKEIADSSYLGYILGFQKTIDEASKRKTGSAVRRIILKDLKQVEIPLPPLEEQRRIAAILDKADGVRRKRKEAIRLTKELLRSTFLEMFGDPVTNPKGWEIVKLEKVSESISYGITASAYFVPTATKMLRITDIQNGEINWESVPFCSGDKKDIQKYSIVSGDIVFARTGATTGKSFLIRHCPENTLFASYLIRVRPSSLISPEYLAYFFKTEFYWKQIQQNSSGSAQPGVNSSKLKELLIILPPIELQKGFARLDIFIQNNLMKMNNFLHQQDNLFNSLLQKAFRGEL
ncbi:type I restriction modification DNA specificity domain protein [Microcystis aeruginosa TAIHU98]|uniref:Type I restriction modification DNA specificity domain protein n=2 Tax=Microcystis aeruginosa TaxID=1126 RepID=L7E480_MICAE|nr:type I restriction modification DNA specificity domain protein [Microcystis aeruginosa TAIHU98]